jgi:hypothetical protein
MKFLAAAALLGVLATSASAEAGWVVRGIGVEERLDDPPIVSTAAPAGDLALTVSLVVVERQFRGSEAAAAFARLDARLALYRTRNIPVVLVFGSLPAGDEIEPWIQSVRGIAARERGKIAAYEIGTISAAPRTDARTYAFALKQAAVQIRAADPDALIAEGPVAISIASTWQAALFTEGVAPYVDVVVVSGEGQTDSETTRRSLSGVDALVARQDPRAVVWFGPIDLAAAGPTASEQLISSSLRSVGTRIGLTVFLGPPPAVRAGIAAAARLSDLFGGDAVALEQGGVRWTRDGVDVTSQVRSKLLYSQSTTDTYLVVESGLGSGAAEVDVSVNTMAPAVRDAFTGAVERLTVSTREAGTARLRLRAPAHPFVVDLNYGVSAPSAVSEVRAASTPAVEEIVAKSQQLQAAQDAALKTYIAHLRIEQHFRPTPADPAYNIVTENRLFADASGRDKEWEELSFSINGATWTKDRPSFPLVQPEKVLSLPLDLRLSDDYRYRLAGIEALNGRDAFVVRFEPLDTARALYRGTMWIDRETFARVKVSAVQTPGGGPVSANEEDQYFTRVGQVDGTPIWLLTKLSGRQTLLVAGRTILNERELNLTDIQLNPAEFQGARAEARGGDQLMYKDTDAGVRYFVKKGTGRVVSDNLTASARALAMGADFDPSLQYPLPIAGIDILDFNFLHRDMQLALLFGGVIAFGNIQRAGLWNGRLDASVDFFGLAVKTDDSIFDGKGERRGERVRSTPASTGFNLGYRIDPSHKVTGRIDLRYDRYSRDAQTAADFVAPSSTLTIGEGLGYEFRRRGYSLLTNISTYRRNGWASWGDGLSFDPATRTYLKYDAGISKDFIFRTFHTVHVNGQWFGGERLDRFSMYQFGLFDATRMHGVPSAVRFSELAMIRGSYSFNVFDIYRFSLFVDHAVGRDVRVDREWRPVTGVGFSLNFRGPRGTLFQGDVGRSRLPPIYRGAGSTVVQLMILKPL